MVSKQTPSPLADAIRAQQAVVNQLADEHHDAVLSMQDKGAQLAKANNELAALLWAQQTAK